MPATKNEISLNTLNMLAENAMSQAKQRGPDSQWGAAWAYQDVVSRMFGHEEGSKTGGNLLRQADEMGI